MGWHKLVLEAFERMIPEDPDYEQAKDTLHNACVPCEDEIWFHAARASAVYIRSIVPSHSWPIPDPTCSRLQIHVYEQLGRYNAWPCFKSFHYPMESWRAYWVSGALKRLTEKEAFNFIGEASLAEMRRLAAKETDVWLRNSRRSCKLSWEDA